VQETRDSGESPSSQRSTAGSTPATKKRKASSDDDIEDIPVMSLLSPPQKGPPSTHALADPDISLLSPPATTREVIDLRSPHSSRKVSARRQAKYRTLDSRQYYSVPSPVRETELSPPRKIPTSEFKGDRTHMKTFRAGAIGTMARFNNEQPTFMWDTGANRSGTSNKSILKNVTACDPISISGAFGPPINPTLKGELGPLKLDTVVIDGMGPQSIISVSQVCQLGPGHVALFTANSFRVYTLPTAMRAMKVLTHDGKEVVRGTVQNGLYIHDST
jgi:hypothetical protein